MLGPTPWGSILDTAATSLSDGSRVWERSMGLAGENRRICSMAQRTRRNLDILFVPITHSKIGNPPSNCHTQLITCTRNEQVHSGSLLML